MVKDHKLGVRVSMSSSRHATTTKDARIIIIKLNKGLGYSLYIQKWVCSSVYMSLCEFVQTKMKQGKKSQR